MRFHRLIGLTGVAAHETPEARRWGRRLEWPMLLVALWIPVQWYFETKELLPHVVLVAGNWLTWLFFLGETTLLASLVRNRQEYFKDNWMNLAIILTGIPILWNHTALAGIFRDLRLLLMLALLLRFFPVLGKVLRRNQLGATVGIALVVMVLAGIVIAEIDPAITSIWDGIWYAWVTMSTVGYGDVVPASGPGRIMGGILILFGMVLFSVITANIAAFLLSSDVEKVEKDMEKVEKEENELVRDLREIRAQLKRIEERLGENKTRASTGRKPRGTRIKKR
jgi:voltage-gated potassium channel